MKITLITGAANGLGYELVKLALKNDIYVCNIDRDIDNVYVSDLLSYVMAHGEENTLWLTVLKHVNIIAVAQLHDFAGIVFGLLASNSGTSTSAK